MRIGGNTGNDSDESVIRIGGNTSQLTDLGESVMRIGGNTGQLTDSGESINENRWEHRSIDGFG